MTVPDGVARLSASRGNHRPDGRRTLSVPMAAKVAGVCERTVYNWLYRDEVDWWREPVFGSIRVVADSMPRRRAA